MTTFVAFGQERTSRPTKLLLIESIWQLAQEAMRCATSEYPYTRSAVLGQLWACQQLHRFWMDTTEAELPAGMFNHVEEAEDYARIACMLLDDELRAPTFLAALTQTIGETRDWIIEFQPMPPSDSPDPALYEQWQAALPHHDPLWIRP